MWYHVLISLRFSRDLSEDRLGVFRRGFFVDYLCVILINVIFACCMRVYITRIYLYLT